MITVSVIVNGHPVAARSAVFRGVRKGQLHEYKLDDGTVIQHSPEEGIIQLAVAMLLSIKEPAVCDER